MEQPITEESRSPIVPIAKGLYLCDSVIDYENGKVDLCGLLNAIRASNYPHMQRRFCVFAHSLTGWHGYRSSSIFETPRAIS